MNNKQLEQINLDKLTAKEALKRYLSNFLIPERNSILENLVSELNKDDIINIDWVEIY